MEVISNRHEIYARIAHERNSGRSVGLVPTMGALHAGHVSLLERSSEICDVNVATIFVNPSQFGPKEDFTRYPRTLEDDLAKLERAGANYVYVPDAHSIYPPGYSTYIEPPAVGNRWEGECRPGHFRGVATIVLKLFQLIPATVSFFGRKDYQQALVIRKMVEDLNVPMRIETCPTLREPDGLAMSSRNRYLSAPERLQALGLWHALQAASDKINTGEKKVAVIERELKQTLNDHQIEQIDYAVVVNAETLEPLEMLEGAAVILIAARVGSTRLIDNLLIEG
jgi:pantoate--beta-alanine ligase